MLRAKSLKFIGKLFAILFNDQCRSVISWSQDGNSFMILQEFEMPRILQEYFISDKIKSFYRQLRIYGFRMKKNKLGIREFNHPEFNINLRYPIIQLSHTLNPIFRKTQLKNEMAQELNELRRTTKHLQLQQLQILKKLNISIRIHNQIQKLMEYIRQQYYYCQKRNPDENAYNFMRSMFTLYLSHKQLFHCDQSFEQLSSTFEVDNEIYTPRLLC